MEPEKTRNQRSLLDYLILVLKGICMGASDVIPGVSGGTMAFILGIYEELIFSIKSFDLECVRLALRFRFREVLERIRWKFLLAVLSGIGIAIVSLARALAWLLQNEPVFIWSFFFGLISASVITVSRRVNKWSFSLLGSAALGAAGAFWLVGLIPAQTPNATWYLFLSGAIAICAMILPGISGAFILVLFGKYQYVLQALNNHDLVVLATVATGAVVGIILFSRLLGWLFSSHHDFTVSILTGFMLGSLRKIWPWKKASEVVASGHSAAYQVYKNVFPDHVDMRTIWALALMALGCLVVLALDRMATQKPQ